jgi:hypothetical protein
MLFCAHELEKMPCYSAATPKSINSKSVTHVSIIGIMLTPKEVPPLGVLEDKPWPPAVATATAHGVANRA